MDYSAFVIGVVLYIPCSLLVAWIVSMEKENYLQKIDQKISDEIIKNYNIDHSYISKGLMPDITYIRHDCKIENRRIFIIIVAASYISFIAGSIFILRSP